MSRLSLYKTPTTEQTGEQLARLSPSGRSFSGKFLPTSDLNKLIVSLAKDFNIVQQQIEHLVKEFNINTTDDLLPEWEASVRLPDECINSLTTLEERRSAVISQLKRAPIVSKAEYEALGTELAGVAVTVTAGWDYELATATPDKYSRFKLYVSFINPATGFPYVFPYPFGGFRADIVECVFNKITPATVTVILV